MDAEDRFCPALMELLKSYNFQGVVEHRRIYCFDCAEVKMKAASKDREELLFANAPPPWLSKSVVEDEHMEDINEANESTRVAPKKINISAAPKVVARTESEIEEYLLDCARKRMSDNMLENEIRKHLRCDPVQMSLKRMELCQKIAKEKRTEPTPDELNPDADKPKSPEKAKEQNLQNKGKPYQPELSHFFPRDERSKLDIKQTKRFMGILTNILLQGIYQHESNKNDLKAFGDLVTDERAELVEMVKTNFSTAVSDLEKLVYKEMFTYVMKRAQKRYGPVNDSPQTPHKVFSWKSESEQGIRMVPTRIELLLKGNSDQIRLPDMKSKVNVNVNAMESRFSSFHANMFPIHQDENIENLCLEHHLQFAMDSTTACHLMCDSFWGFDYSYYIPLEVTRSTANGNLFNYTVLGKPSPYGNFTRSHVLRTYMKYMTKSSFIFHKRKARLDRYRSMSKSRKESEMSTLTSSTNDDMLGGILSTMTDGPAKETISSTGKLYSSFSFGMQNVLIRGSMPLHCKEGPPVFVNKNVSYQSFVELFPDISPMVLSDEEKLWSFVKQQFKQSDEHVICRTAFKLEDKNKGKFNVLQYHNITHSLYNSSQDDPEFLKRLSYRTRRLESLLAELSTLSPGRYFLCNNRQGDLQLLNDTCISDREAKMPDKKLYGCSARSVELTEVFKGFEKRIFFQWQVMHTRAPGCFFTKESLPDEALKKSESKMPSTSQFKGNSNRGRGRGRGHGGKRGRN